MLIYMSKVYTFIRIDVYIYYSLTLWQEIFSAQK